ncbi:MAG: DUF547 domain-containing protein [Acidobacteriota bacterium]|nr:MAG: DUF547 domain-containing protein [Acidobacteriota bacterium]
MSRSLSILILILMTGVGTVAAQTIDYSEYDRLTRKYVDDRGLVDYKGLKGELPALKRFVDQLAAVSPDSHPQQFRDGGEQLRYWMTAYNTWVLYIAASEYPSRSALWNFLGLFRNRTIKLGGRQLGLEDLEHGIIRKRYKEPRIHFYINCAAFSCPALWQGAIGQGTTWDVLEQSARRFINDPRHVKFDPATGRLQISKIFDWFEDDFLDYLRDKKGIQSPHISQYILLYLQGPARDALAKTPVNQLSVKYFSYDKNLNESSRK